MPRPRAMTTHPGLGSSSEYTSIHRYPPSHLSIPYMSVQGKLSGCDIKSYLFEKSRITQQQEVERSYHIFYQMLQPAVPELKVRPMKPQTTSYWSKEKCLLSDAIYDYTYVSQGRTKVLISLFVIELSVTRWTPLMTMKNSSSRTLLSTSSDFLNPRSGTATRWGWQHQCDQTLSQLTAAVMTMGEMKFKQKGRDEQCEPDKNNDNFRKVNEGKFNCSACFRWQNWQRWMSAI